jgi:hypothetical protein
LSVDFVTGLEQEVDGKNRLVQNFYESFLQSSAVFPIE